MSAGAYTVKLYGSVIKCFIKLTAIALNEKYLNNHFQLRRNLAIKRNTSLRMRKILLDWPMGGEVCQQNKDIRFLKDKQTMLEMSIVIPRR